MLESLSVPVRIVMRMMTYLPIRILMLMMTSRQHILDEAIYLCCVLIAYQTFSRQPRVLWLERNGMLSSGLGCFTSSEFGY